MSEKQTESQIQQAILLTLGQLPDVRLWRQNSGMAVPLNARGADARPVRYGVNGCGDLSGLLTVAGLGLRLEVEVKKPGGRQSDDQRRFQAMVEARGGVYLLARSVEEALEQLQAARVRIAGQLLRAVEGQA